MAFFGYENKYYYHQPISILDFFSRLAATSDMLEPFLDGMTLDEALAAKSIYMVDLKVLHKLKCPAGRVVRVICVIQVLGQHCQAVKHCVSYNIVPNTLLVIPVLVSSNGFSAVNTLS